MAFEKARRNLKLISCFGWFLIIVLDIKQGDLTEDELLGRRKHVK